MADSQMLKLKAKNMQEWNVVITVYDFKRACDILGDYVWVQRTEFYNTLLIKVQDVHQLLEALLDRSVEDHEFLSFLSKIIPVTGNLFITS